ncbi:hypothetical protein ACJX0J_018529, partial [Zea mays]
DFTVTYTHTVIKVTFSHSFLSFLPQQNILSLAIDIINSIDFHLLVEYTLSISAASCQESSSLYFLQKIFLNMKLIFIAILFLVGGGVARADENQKGTEGEDEHANLKVNIAVKLQLTGHIFACTIIHFAHVRALLTTSMHKKRTLQKKDDKLEIDLNPKLYALHVNKTHDVNKRNHKLLLQNQGGMIYFAPIKKNQSNFNIVTEFTLHLHTI